MKKTILIFALLALVPVAAQAQVCPTPSQLDADLTAASQGAVISLSGVLPLTCPEIAMTETWTGGKLIFSDSPESPTTRGKLYEDGTLAATSGTVYNRIWVLHVNQNPTKNMKFGVLIKNLGSSNATLTIQKKGWKGPGTSTAWVQMGMDAFKDWLNSTAGSPVTVAPGATVRLDSAFEVSVAKGSAMHGMWDYSMSQPHQVTVCAVHSTDTMLTTCPTLSVLARDVHNRGTFEYADKVFDTAAGVTIDTATGIQQFVVGGQGSYDSVVSGIDVPTGSTEQLAGNIGVLYRMHLSTVSTDSQNLGFVINPRGGWWGGAFKSLIGQLSQSASICPTTGGGLGDNTKACVVNRYTPGGGLSVWVQFMITASANAPVRFLAIPH